MKLEIDLFLVRRLCELEVTIKEINIKKVFLKYLRLISLLAHIECPYSD